MGKGKGFVNLEAPVLQRNNSMEQFAILKSEASVAKLDEAISNLSLTFKSSKFVAAIQKVCGNPSQRCLICALIGNELELSPEIVIEILQAADIYGTIKLFHEIYPDLDPKNNIFFRNGVSSIEISIWASTHFSEFNFEKFHVTMETTNISDTLLEEFVMTSYLSKLVDAGQIAGTWCVSPGYDNRMLLQKTRKNNRCSSYLFSSNVLERRSEANKSGLGFGQQTLNEEKSLDTIWCTHCEKELGNKKYDYKRHASQCHDKYDTIKCTIDECQRKFRYQAALDIHLMEKHARNEIECKCGRFKGSLQ